MIGKPRRPTVAIASALSEPVVNVKKLLFRTLRSGEVAKVGYGLYRLPPADNEEIGVSPITPITPRRQPRLTDI